MTKTSVATALTVLALLGSVPDPALARKVPAPPARRDVTPAERAHVIEQVRRKRSVEPDSDFSSMVLYKDASGTIHACGLVHARARDGLFVYEGQRLFWATFVPGQPPAISGPYPEGTMEEVYRKICRSKGLAV